MCYEKKLPKIFYKWQVLGRDTDIILKSTWETTKKRFPWLLATYVGGLIAAFVIGAYHDLLSPLSF